MRLPVNFLVLIAYALAAAGFAVWLPTVLADVSTTLGYIAGGFAFLLVVLLHLAGHAAALGRVQARFMEDVAEQIETAFMNQRKLEDDLLQVKASLANLTSGTQGSAQRDVGEVVSEVKVLQSLVQRLYSARAKPPARQSMGSIQIKPAQATQQRGPAQSAPMPTQPTPAQPLPRTTDPAASAG
jgi:cyclic-di-GMP phosphodiesterase, flagellum assembly factor TipF